MTDEIVQKLIAELNDKLDKIRPQLEEIKEVYALLDGISKHTGASLNLPDLHWLLGKGEAQKETASHHARITIRPDTFYGKELTDATEEYIKMVGHAARFEEIYKALVKGGSQIESEAGKEKLNTALTRATRRFKKFGSGSEDASFGLLSWYEKKKKTKTEEVVEKLKESEPEKTEENSTEKEEKEKDLTGSE